MAIFAAPTTVCLDVSLNIKAEQHMSSDKPSILMRHKLAAFLKAHAQVEASRR